MTRRLVLGAGSAGEHPNLAGKFERAFPASPRPRLPRSEQLTFTRLSRLIVETNLGNMRYVAASISCSSASKCGRSFRSCPFRTWPPRCSA
jgi:hypothetical protein